MPGRLCGCRSSSSSSSSSSSALRHQQQQQCFLRRAVGAALAPAATSASSSSTRTHTTLRAFSSTATGSSRQPSDAADRVREVWDDEEDVAAAASRLGYDRDSSAADSGPLISEVNRMYVEQQQYPQEGWLGPLELRYIPGGAGACVGWWVVGGGWVREPGQVLLDGVGWRQGPHAVTTRMH
jgi:hypothetical protein